MPQFDTQSTSAPFTYPPEFTPEQIYILENEPQDLTPKYSKPFAQFLYTNDEPKSARRFERCSTWWDKHRLRNGNIVTRNLNPCHEVTACENCAHLRFEEEFERYSVLERVIPESFTYVVTTPERSAAIRKLLKKLAPILSRFSWQPEANHIAGHFESRILLCATSHAIPYKILQKIREIDPHVWIKSYGTSRFRKVLERMLMPTLPEEYANRLILKRYKRRLVFEGANQATRKLLFDTKGKFISNKNSEDEVKIPFCTIKNCVAHTQPYWMGQSEGNLVWILAPSPPV